MDKSKEVLTGLLLVLSAVAATVVLLTLYKDLSIVILVFTMVLIPIAIFGVYMGITGKGSMMIAGYNTMPKSARDCYNTEKMTKTVGWFVAGVVTLLYAGMVAVTVSENNSLFWILIAAEIAVVSVALIYFNTGGRFLKDPNVKPPKPTKAERSKQIRIAAVIIVALLIALVGIFLFTSSGNVTVSIEDDGFTVDAPMMKESVLYSDIDSVELRENIDLGSRTNGFGGSAVSSGQFRNQEFGNYDLASYNSVRTYIVVHHSGSVLVFNMDSMDKTRVMYTMLEHKTVSPTGFISETGLPDNVAFVR